MTGSAGNGDPPTQVKVSGGQGVQVGDHGTQNNTYIQTYIETQVIKPSPRPCGWAGGGYLPVALAQLPGAGGGFHRPRWGAGRVRRAARPGAGGAVVVSAVAGLAGVGKTTLAVQAGHAARLRAGFRAGCCSSTCMAMTMRRCSRSRRWSAAARAGRPCRAYPAGAGGPGRAVPVGAGAGQPVRCW